MSEEEGQKIADLKIKGVNVVAESVRSYPQGQLASQVLGFVDSSNNGRYGLEGYYNDELNGISGQIMGQRDTLGRMFDINSQVTAQDGADFYLTIDTNIQYKAEQVLADAITKYAADNGSIIITDPNTGAILAMAGSPTLPSPAPPARRRRAGRSTPGSRAISSRSRTRSCSPRRSPVWSRRPSRP